MKLKPNFSRPVLSLIGILIGGLLYGLLQRLGSPWSSVGVGAFLVTLGVSVYVYAQGERWIQVLGGVLIVYGVIRAFLLH